ncbi:MAG: hypothetical protein ACJAT2_001480 [Bacteriovoracaceae bacterium]|jgi:hypothetical protein
MKVLLVISVLFSFSSFAAPELKRDILAFYDSSEFSHGRYENSYLHKKLEVVFNHYGFKLEYHDVKNGLPKILSNKVYVKKFAGIVNWFTDDKMGSPIAFSNFLEEQLRAGQKLMIIGKIGFLRDSKDKLQSSAVINQVFQHMGLKYFPLYYDNPLILTPQKRSDSKMIEFERELEHEVFEVLKTESYGKKNTVHLSVKIAGEEKPADVVVSGPNFFYAQHGYALFENPQDYITSWRIDPFHFISELLLSELEPIPETNTLCGRRMAYSHIDGDGFINVSNLDRKSLSGKIVLDRIIKKYKIPTTASIVVAEIDPNLLGNRQAVTTSKEIFRAPFIEPASHTYSHPLSWNKMATKEEASVYLDDKEAKKHKGQILAYKIKNYKLDYKTETIDSIAYINKELAPPSNPAKVILWSGSCMPPEEALKLTTEAGYLNMNGGDSRMDALYKGYSNLSGLYRKVGDYIQVYTSNANENLYTNLWTGPFSGFRDVIETFKSTEEPRRIKPMNIYYHFYSGEHISSIKSLEEVYEYVLDQKPSLIFASDYIKWVQGFRNTKINKFNRLRYDFSHYGHLRTFRIEKTDMIPDYQKSKNIIGHQHHQGNLYVFLGGKNKAHLKLTDQPANAPYVSSCNGWMESFEQTGKTINFKGYSRSEFEVEITKPNNKKAVYKSDGLGIFEKSIEL